MTKNDMIYNALPYIYTFGGVTALLASQETIGKISGVLLVSAALMIFHLRLENRTRRAETAEEGMQLMQHTLAPQPAGRRR